MDNELALLGCILLDSQIIKQVQSTGEDFSNPEYRQLFGAMSELSEDGVDIEPMAIAGRLKDPKLIKHFVTIQDYPLSIKSWKNLDDTIRTQGAKRKVYETSQILARMAKNGSSPEDLYNKITELASSLSEKIKGKKTLAKQIDDWIEGIGYSTFIVTELDKELGIVTKQDKENRRKIMNRLVHKGQLAKASQRQGHYRIVDSSLETIDYRAVISTEPFKIKWPFSIENLVTLLPKSIAIVAGSWESGKTAFLLNVARMNMDRHTVRYMSSEMGDAEFKLRLNLFVDMAPDDWHIEAIERSADWEDAILPDGINIIDYLELSDAFYNVGEKIRKIFDRLKGGIAIIAIQKATGKDLGRGGDFTAEKARLYLSLDPGELTIVKGKLWANPQVSPKNMTMKFKLWQGHKFVAQGDWFKKIKTKD